MKDKVTIITGGASGIGLAIAKDFLERGAKVVIADWAETGSEVVASFNNDNIRFIKTDVSDEEQVKDLISQTIEWFDRLDIMVANAGIGDSSLLHEEETAYWDKVVAVNLRGIFLCNKYAILAMLNNKQGSIINMSSILGIVGEAIAPAYCACKAGINNLTRSGAIAYAKEGIRINAIAPGYIITPLLDGLSNEIMEDLKTRHPIGRMGTVNEVVPAVRFLADDNESSFITGIVLPIDGGYTAI